MYSVLNLCCTVFNLEFQLTINLKYSWHYAIPDTNRTGRVWDYEMCVSFTEPYHLI